MKSSRRWVVLMAAALATIVAVAIGATANDSTATGATVAERAAELHGKFTHLLAKYVSDGLVDYDRWHANRDDSAVLNDYVDSLAALDPEGLPSADAEAYWINLYNAVTLRLILHNYPLESIKDIGGLLKSSPWKRKLVTVGGRALTLNAIENDIIRPTFRDPRVHFALNCASLGCPPLRTEAYLAPRLDAQLDDACRNALNRERWVRVDGDELKLTKIFDWYGDDFQANGGSVLAFIRRYRTRSIPDGHPKISYMPYDWSLNRVPQSATESGN